MLNCNNLIDRADKKGRIPGSNHVESVFFRVLQETNISKGNKMCTFFSSVTCCLEITK
jgi:hypothetical protein